MSAQQTVGVRTEEASAVFKVKNFSFVLLSGTALPAEDLNRNCVSSDPILRCGPFCFKIMVAWSLAQDGTVQEHSMLGVAIQRVDHHCGEAIATIRISLLNIDPSCSVTKETPVIRYGEGNPARGWYPSCHAEKREDLDGFVLLKTVLDTAHGWLVEDTLTAKCTMTIAASGVEQIAPSPATGSSPSDLGPQLGALLESGKYSDIVIRIGSEEIHAHRAILAARSPVFDAMWSSPMREGAESEVRISDVDPAALRRLLRYLYAGALDTDLQDDEETIALLTVAHMYEVPGLVQTCAAWLSANLTVELVAERLMLADLVGIEGLRQECLNFITRSLSQVSAVQCTEGFARLAEKRPDLAVKILAAAVPPTVNV